MGPGGPGSPLLLDQTEAPKARKKFFGRLPPPPPLSLRVRCLPLPPLPSPWVPVNMWSEFILEYRNVVYLYYFNLKFFIQLVKDTLWQVKNIVSTMKLKTTVKVIFASHLLYFPSSHQIQETQDLVPYCSELFWPVQAGTLDQL